VFRTALTVLMEAVVLDQRLAAPISVVLDAAGIAGDDVVHDGGRVRVESDTARVGAGWIGTIVRYRVVADHDATGVAPIGIAVDPG